MGRAFKLRDGHSPGRLLTIIHTLSREVLLLSLALPITVRAKHLRDSTIH